MNNFPTPRFLVIEVPDLVAARTAFPVLARLAAAAGGVVHAAALPREVAVLEPGTALVAVFIARWPDSAGLDAFWESAPARAAFAPVAAVAGARAVSVAGVPAAGLADPFLPTAANVAAPASATAPAYMLVQGSVTTLEPIQQYVAIIMPMLRERSSYYVVYAQPPDVSVKHGAWSDHAFIISRWPTLAAAEDFWFSDLYQNLAIPTRTGHGTFSVVLLPGLAG